MSEKKYQDYKEKLEKLIDMRSDLNSRIKEKSNLISSEYNKKREKFHTLKTLTHNRVIDDLDLLVEEIEEIDGFIGETIIIRDDLREELAVTEEEITNYQRLIHSLIQDLDYPEDLIQDYFTLISKNRDTQKEDTTQIILKGGKLFHRKFEINSINSNLIRSVKKKESFYQTFWNNLNPISRREYLTLLVKQEIIPNSEAEKYVNLDWDELPSSIQDQIAIILDFIDVDIESGETPLIKKLDTELGKIESATERLVESVREELSKKARKELKTTTKKLYKRYVSFNTRIINETEEIGENLLERYKDTSLEIQDKFKEIAEKLELLFEEDEYGEPYLEEK